MAWWLKLLATLPDDPDSICSTLMVAQDSLLASVPGDLMFPLLASMGTAGIWYTNREVGKVLIQLLLLLLLLL